MRRVLWLFVSLLFVAAATAAGAAPKQMYVTVKQTDVRATAGYLGKSVGTLTYGAQVTILDTPAGTPKGWVKVLGPDKVLTGFVNTSALTEKAVQLASTSGVQQTASSGDVALAGKGFNADVEAKYKEEEKLDYTWVDKMQSYQVPSDQVAEFLAAGGLGQQGGGQ